MPMNDGKKTKKDGSQCDDNDRLRNLGRLKAGKSDYKREVMWPKEVYPISGCKPCGLVCEQQDMRVSKLSVSGRGVDPPRR